MTRSPLEIAVEEPAKFPIRPETMDYLKANFYRFNIAKHKKSIKKDSPLKRELIVSSLYSSAF